MINLLLFGPPGAGKGTQSEKLINKYGFIHLSTGDIFRESLASETRFGIEAKAYIEKGELVPDQIVIGMVSEEINKYPEAKGFVFDGFPRTSAQADALDELLKEHDTEISKMLSLEVGETELISRLSKRAKESGRKDDQDISIIKNRLDVYKNNTRPLIEYYTKKGKYVSINGKGKIDEIFTNMCKVVDLLF